MTVEVTEEKDVSTFESFLHHQLGVIEDWVLLAAGPNPLAIEIQPYNTAPIVPDNDSIRVQHGDNFEYECVS